MKIKQLQPRWLAGLFYLGNPVNISIMNVVIISMVGYLGATLGSFAGAQVWRLRARQLVEDKKRGEKVNAKEMKTLKPLVGKNFRTDRSKCLACGHDLRWYDLLPLVSWLILGGRCRYCKSPIGITEIFLEVLLAIVFAASVAFWPGVLNAPVEVIKLLIWLAALVVLAINFVYDLRWSLLVSWLNWALIGLGVVFSLLTITQSSDWTGSVISLGAAVLILGGLYAMLWLLSQGRWIGEGDIYLGTGLALFLVSWPLAFIALFAANLLGTVIVIPMMLSGRLQRGSHMPFGPLLIMGALISWFFGALIMDWYLGLMFL